MAPSTTKIIISTPHPHHTYTSKCVCGGDLCEPRPDLAWRFVARATSLSSIVHVPPQWGKGTVRLSNKLVGRRHCVLDHERRVPAKCGVAQAQCAMRNGRTHVSAMDNGRTHVSVAFAARVKGAQGEGRALAVRACRRTDTHTSLARLSAASLKSRIFAAISSSVVFNSLMSASSVISWAIRSSRTYGYRRRPKGSDHR